MVLYGALAKLKEHFEYFNAHIIEEDKLLAEARPILDELNLIGDACFRFGLVMPLNNDRYPTSIFSRWFNWWLTYVITLPTEARSRMICAAYVADVALDAFRPDGDWLKFQAVPSDLISTWCRCLALCRRV